MKIQMILNEMISTERNYREGLELINGIRASLAEHTSGILDPLDQLILVKGLELLAKISAKQVIIEQLFANLNLYLDQDLLHLTDTINNLNILLEQTSKDYANYAIFYDNYANNIAPKLANQKQINRLIRKAGGGLHLLPDFLITPVQRFIRYNMLIKELSNALPETHHAKGLLQQLTAQIGEYCQNNEQTAEFFASVKEKFTGITLPDSRFRRQVKACLDNFMQGINHSPILLDIINNSGLTIQCKHKRFSNKREYCFTNQAGQRIFNIIVNRHAMAFQFTEHFDNLPVNEKIALFRLQYFLTLSIENQIGIKSNHHIKRNLEILGEVEYYHNTPNAQLHIVNEDEDEDEVEENIEEVKYQPMGYLPPRVTPAFSLILNNLLKKNQGLSRQGSLAKPEFENGTETHPYQSVTKWKLPGLT